MADISLNYIKKLLLKLKSFFSAKDVLSFMGFLLISASFWFFNALNKEKELSAYVQINYVDIPPDIMFNEELPTSVTIKISDLGSNLWKYLRYPVQPITLKFTQSLYDSGYFNVTNSQLKSRVSDNLLPSSSILTIYPEAISSSYVKLFNKRVPVALIGDIKLENQYMFLNPIQIYPKEVDIFGPNDVIENINEVKTQRLDVGNLKDSISISVPLEKIESVRYSNNNITVKAYAEMFTEKTAKLPVQTINKPDSVEVLLFPAEIEAVFNISVKHYRSFQNSDIQIIVDFSDVYKGDGKKKKLKIVNNKPYISNIRIKPEEIDFLLQGK